MEKGIKRFSWKHLSNKFETVLTQKLHPDWPWWPKEAVKICEMLIRPSDKVLEFGSGRSTFWLADKCASITSIEHHNDWYQIVKKKLQASRFEHKVNLVLTPLITVENNYNQPYLLVGKEMESASIDIVIVDGKYRAEAAELSLLLLKSGGVLIIDDAHRYLSKTNSLDAIPDTPSKAIWQDISNQTKNWRSLWTTDGIHATAFFIKP